MHLVFACNFSKNRSIQNVYFKTLIFSKSDQTSSKHENVALWVKVAMNLLKVFPENQLVCTMKMCQLLHAQFASKNLMGKTDFYHFSNMLWTHPQFLRALMMRQSISWATSSFWFFYRYSKWKFEKVSSVVLEPKSMFLVPSMTNNGTTTLTTKRRVDLIWESNSLRQLWHKHLLRKRSSDQIVSPFSKNWLVRTMKSRAN